MGVALQGSRTMGRAGSAPDFVHYDLVFRNLCCVSIVSKPTESVSLQAMSGICNAPLRLAIHRECAERAFDLILEARKRPHNDPS